MMTIDAGRRMHGFTLLELLTGHVGPIYHQQIGKSEVKTARAQMDAFGKALAHYRLDTGRIPSTEPELCALTDKLAADKKWDDVAEGASENAASGSWA
jgi:general secretion pathway protein G